VTAIEHAFTGLPVADLPAALAWYERLLGREPNFSPNEDEAVWQLTDTAWIYVVRDAERAGRGLLTVLVDDLEALVAGFGERGIDAGEMVRFAEVMRRVRFTDPEGNRLTFAENLGAPAS
jgi:catechol 2,3-dioxygenase-like lactoylglutathione lyase family enzyme